MRQKTVVLLLLVLLCYILGLVTASYFPIPAHFGAVLTTLLQGKIRPFVVKRNFSETIGYITDRKPGPAFNGNVSYLGEYAGQLFWLIHDGYPAAKRHLLKYKGTKKPTEYWVIPP